MIFLFFRSYFQLSAKSLVFLIEKKQKDTTAIWARAFKYLRTNYKQTALSFYTTS